MKLVLKYFSGLSNNQIVKLEALGPLYREWNTKINIISRKDIEHLYERHILHSLSIAKIISFKDHTKILDVGTGGGFPGIPLAILFPKVQFRLIDSMGKKIQVVSSLIDELKLKNVKAARVRVENDPGRYDFIISRAVTALPAFFKYIEKRIIPGGFNDLANGVLYIKGGQFEKELKKINNPFTLYPLSDFFQEAFFSTKKVVHIFV